MRTADDAPARTRRASPATTVEATPHAPAPHTAAQLISSTPADPYEAMLELAGHELSLAQDGRLRELCELAPTWARLTAALPAQAPSRARASLQSTVELQRRTHDTLLARREEMLDDLQRTTHASRAANGYARVTQQMGTRVDRNA